MNENNDPILLILNAGSSSIKFAAFACGTAPTALRLLCEGQMSGIGHAIHFHATGGDSHTLVNSYLEQGVDYQTAIEKLLAWLTSFYAGRKLAGAGHRVVHGGERYSQPTWITPAVLDEIRSLIPLAPLHQPHHIEAIEILQRCYPDLAQVACFDTAFHQTNSALSTRYALPRELSAGGIRRYGFHGLSYEYIAGVMETLLGKQLAQGRVVVAHLGSGASMCALQNGISVASTMGFTALDGLPMSRRCGALDPGVLLYLMQQKKMSAEQVSELLYNQSGMLGVSGISDDMQTLLNSAEPAAREAIALFVYRINRELGSLVAALGGLDALIFTAGIGEHAAAVRAQVVQCAAWLGLELDQGANDSHRACITTPQSNVSAWVIPTNEDLMIAQHTRQVLLEGEQND